MLVYFTNLSLTEFQVRYLALFLLFSVIDSFEPFWMESLHKNIQLMLRLLKAPFLVLQFSCYTLMTFLGPCEKYLCFRSTDWVNFFNLAHPGSKFWRFFFISSLQTSLGLPVTSFSKKRAIYNKTITLTLEHTFFLPETFIYNSISRSFFFVECCQLNLVETKNILN